MIFHENRLADDSHEISYLIFFRKLRKVSCAAVVIGALRVNKKHDTNLSNNLFAKKWQLELTDPQTFFFFLGGGWGVGGKYNLLIQMSHSFTVFFLRRLKIEHLHLFVYIFFSF